MTVATVGYYQMSPAQEDDFFGMGEIFSLVELNYWNANQHMDDSGSEKPFVPAGFEEVSEGEYAHDFATIEEAKAALEAAGWVEKKMF